MKHLDSQMERFIGLALRVGVGASTGCLLIGLLLSVGGLAPQVSDRLLTVGLMVLIATPVARVIISIVEYLRERDWMFAVLTTVVLLELAASLVAALR